MRTNAEQYHNGNVIATTFEYDPANQLHVVTDVKGGKTVSEYDLAGRRTQVTHPASGTTLFKYDLAGNLTAKQTANLAKTGKWINYLYTYSRLDSISYPDHPENNVRYVYGSQSETGATNYYRAGRLKLQKDGSGAQEFKYGKMGEINEVKRTLVIPNQAVASYTTYWTYDSWNRVQTMTYPDGEVLNYSYNTGGMLSGLTGTKGGDTYTYVSNIGYDRFEQWASMQYGNGSVTTYTYKPDTRQLDNLKVKVGSTNLMDNTYGYDAVSNVTSVMNTGSAMAIPNSTKTIGGGMEHHYEYDDLYRLKKAYGDFQKGNTLKTARYDLAMGYDNLHNITSKKQDIQQTGVQFAGTLKAGYNLSYAYANNPQQISNIADTTYRTEGAIVKTAKSQQYSYDPNGNLICVITGTKNTDGKLIKNNERKLLWDEENRLLALSDNGFVSNYWYDAAGERTVKTFGDAQGVSVNGLTSAATTGTTNFTAYISPYMVVNNGGNYTKHIYIGSQRITSKVSDSGIFGTSPVTTSALQSKYAMLTAKIKTRYDSLGVTYRGVAQTGGLESKTPSAGSSPYFYHSDHLGSSSLITDGSAAVVQHLEYVPFGETFIDERRSASSWTTPYLFSAKERDEETGLTFFGARYYDSRTSVWLSVDPLAEDYPNFSSYSYCYGNPVKFIDPDGRQGEMTIDEKNKSITITSKIYFYGDKSTDKLAKGLAKSIEKNWNHANGTYTDKKTGESYKVNFVVEGESVSKLKAEIIKAFTSDVKNNFIEVTDMGDEHSYMFIGGNSGKFNSREVDESDSKTTASHEYGHGLGLVSKQNGGDAGGHWSDWVNNTIKSPVDIMYARGTRTTSENRYQPNNKKSTLNPMYRSVTNRSVKQIFIENPGAYNEAKSAGKGKIYKQ